MGNNGGFSEQQAENDCSRDHRKKLLDAAAQAFKPELLNRIQKKVIFSPLDREEVQSILNKIIERVNQRLLHRNNRITLTDGAVEFLLQEGFSMREGARRMEQIVEQHLVQPLGMRILEGEIRPGESIMVDFLGLEKLLLFSVQNTKEIS